MRTRSASAFPESGPLLPYLATLPDDELNEILSQLAEDDVAQIEHERYDWTLYARPEQLPPLGNWRVWGIQAGRGGGKTRTGAEWVVRRLRETPGIRIGLFGPTAAKVREVMIEDSESGLLAVAPPYLKLDYQPTRLRVNAANGSRCILYTADNPDRSRGANLHAAWADEVGEWRGAEAWSNLDMALRKTKGNIPPRIVVTTTPRPTELIRSIFQGPKSEAGVRATVQWSVLRPAVGKLPPAFVAKPSIDTVLHRWSTRANQANLSEDFMRRMRDRYEGTHLGRQELEAEILEETPGALWKQEAINAHRMALADCPRLDRLVVSIDPSHSGDGAGDACGIIVAGMGGTHRHAFVRADRTVRASPLDWGIAAVAAYDEFRADLIVYEDNESPSRPSVVRDVIRTITEKRNIRCQAVHASRDKRARADPVSALYQKGQVHHVVDAKDPDQLAALEYEMCTWDPTSRVSPNRLDALVHVVSYLLLQGQHAPTAAPAGTGARVSPWGVS